MENSSLGNIESVKNKRLNSGYDEFDFDENKNIFKEIHNHLLEDECPSYYLNDISHGKTFHKNPFFMLNKLKETMQSPVHHPEGNAWNHTMLVVDEAAKVRNMSKDAEVFMWAALLHDIGKPETTKYRKGRITAYDHDKAGAIRAKDFLEYFSCKEEFIKDVVNLIRWHMHILYVLKDLPFARIEEMKKQVDIQELALLGLCDRVGRLNMDRKKEEENINLFLTKCK